MKNAYAAPDVTLKFTVGEQVSVQTRELPFETHGVSITQNRGIPHKLDLGPQKKKKRIEKKISALSPPIEVYKYSKIQYCHLRGSGRNNLWCHSLCLNGFEVSNNEPDQKLIVSLLIRLVVMNLQQK